MEQILEHASNIGTFGWVVLLVYVLWRDGLIKFSKNGNVTTAQRFDNINGKLDKLTGNDLSHVQEDIRKLQEGQQNIKSCLKDVKNEIRNINEYGVKIRQ